jgi:hypothetical protein
MSLAADALQPHIVRGLLSLSGRAPWTRLADVITDGPRAGYPSALQLAPNRSPDSRSISRKGGGGGYRRMMTLVI